MNLVFNLYMKTFATLSDILEVSFLTPNSFLTISGRENPSFSKIGFRIHLFSKKIHMTDIGPKGSSLRTMCATVDQLFISRCLSHNDGNPYNPSSSKTLPRSGLLGRFFGSKYLQTQSECLGEAKWQKLNKIKKMFSPTLRIIGPSNRGVRTCVLQLSGSSKYPMFEGSGFLHYWSLIFFIQKKSTGGHLAESRVRGTNIAQHCVYSCVKSEAHHQFGLFWIIWRSSLLRNIPNWTVIKTHQWHSYSLVGMLVMAYNPYRTG